MNVSEPFIRRPVATALLMAAVAFVGIAAFPFLPVASLPQIDFPTIQVTASLAGARAEKIGVSVATPLERQLSQIPGIAPLASLSTVGATWCAGPDARRGPAGHSQRHNGSAERHAQYRRGRIHDRGQRPDPQRGALQRRHPCVPKWRSYTGARDTVDQIKARLPRLTANLPPAMTVQTIFDRTEVIRASVHDVEFTLVLTIGIVILVVLLFLRNLWATIIPGITIPLALLGSLGAMYMLNFSLNNLSLMALTIAIGFVVDDAIVVVENIYRHIDDGSSPLEAALKGSREIAFTVLSISLSLVAAFIPLLLMGGIIGRIFREFALTVTASIAVSVLVSLTLAPMLCSRCMKRAEEHGRIFQAIEAGFDSLLSGYRRTLDCVLRHRAITLGVFFATLALTVVITVQIPKGFFPLQDTGLITGVSEAAQDVSPERMMRLQRALGEVILSDPDVQGFASQTGNNDNPTTANTGRFSIVLKPLRQRKAPASQVVERLRSKVAEITGVNLFMQVAQDINVGVRFSRGGVRVHAARRRYRRAG